MSTTAPAAETGPGAGPASKSELAYRVLHERIVAGTYPPGQRLVLDPIGRELDMSVVPVREAIRRLEAEGLVTFARNVGARVTEIDSSAYQHTMETLCFVEGAAILLAAPQIGTDRITAARDLNDQLRDQVEHLDPLRFTALNEQFHRTLTDCCPNPHLRELVDRSWTRLAHLRQSTFSYVPERTAASVEEHEQILQLLEEHADPRRIELTVRAHRLATPDAFLHRRTDPAPSSPTEPATPSGDAGERTPS